MDRDNGGSRRRIRGSLESSSSARVSGPVCRASKQTHQWHGRREVKRIIVEHLGIDEAKVVPKARLAEDLGADSLDVVELVLALEEAFDIEIPEEEGEKLRTVNDVIRCVQSHVKTPKKSTDSKGNS
jgi:acyl carrier protein